MVYEFLPEDIRKKVLGQAEIVIGTAGHIDHGKTTLIKSITGKWTDTHSEEIRRGITIKLGYANASLFYDKSKEPPEAYTTFPMHENVEFIEKVSFIDSPGHESLMIVMLSGASLIDGAILVIAANEKVPKAQTIEHLVALKTIGVKNLIVVQNKVDKVKREDAIKNKEDIEKFLENFGFDPSNIPIIPVSAFYNINTDLVLEAIVKFIPKPKRDLESDPLFLVARSFDINQPGTPPEKFVGGILGGVLKRGVLKVGDEIEIVPGFIEEDGSTTPIYTEITSIHSGDAFIDKAIPGGSVGIGTNLDPILTKQDRLIGSEKLAGNVVGLPGKTPEVFSEIDVDLHLFSKIVSERGDVKEISNKVREGENIVITAWTQVSVGVIDSVRDNVARIKLQKPIAIEKGERIVISRMIEGSWRLSGYGMIL